MVALYGLETGASNEDDEDALRLASEFDDVLLLVMFVVIVDGLNVVLLVGAALGLDI